MLLVAAAVCPDPPIPVPGFVVGAAVAGPAGAPDLVVLVGPGATPGPLPSPYRGSPAPWGTP